MSDLTNCGGGGEASAVVVTERGFDWGLIANELDWESANATDVDALEALRMSVESQLSGEYWDSESMFDVTLTAEQAQMLDGLRTKWADEGR